MLNFIFSAYRKIFAKNIFLRLNKLLYGCSIRGLGVYNYENMLISGEISFINKELKIDAIKKNKYIVFDVGANKGEYSKLISDGITNAKIFSFEPHPKTFKVLSSNCHDIDNIKLFNCALSSKISVLKLYDYKSNDGSAHASLSSEIFTTVHNSELVSHEVDVSTIDSICKENKIENINFLKIDVEGYELDVLKGAKSMLDNNKIKYIQFEFTQLNVTTRVYFKDFWDILSKKYKIYRLLPNSLLEIKNYSPTYNEIFGYQNFVAIHKEI